MGRERNTSIVSGLKARTGLRSLVGLLAAIGLLAALTMPALAASVTPIPISDDNNPTCSNFGAWTELKVEPPGDGTFSDGTLTVTIENFTNSDPKGFDWTSNIGVDAVLVKAGSDKHNLYVYDPESMGDTQLGPQAGSGNGISHISFCYDAGGSTPTPTPTPSPTPRESELGGTPTPTPRESELGGNPTPTPELPDTATTGLEVQVPSLILALILVASLAALMYARLATDRR
jgi:hypothetical protein